MISIIDKHNCCGCEACVQVCPKHCINFKQDQEGFFYPTVDEDICIQCGLCEKVCPVLHHYEERRPQEVLAAINQNEEVRMASSSGGVFTLLAEHIIDQGGIVFGVRFDDEWLAVFDFTENKEKLAAFRGSKYLQARVGDSYVRCKEFLDQGRQVLFSGTQCQIAGLLHFLRKPYSNLLAVDFICHGVPSPKVWSKYLDEVVSAGRRAISDISFRDKRLGWKCFSFAIDYDERNRNYTLTSAFPENPFMRAFLENLILRPSCYKCPAKGGRSHADITIADFWGIQQIHPEMDDDKGISLVLIHTDKGQQALQRDKLICQEASYDDVLRFNSAVALPALCHPKRAEFFNAFNSQTDLHVLIGNCLRPSKIARIKMALKRPLKLIKKLGGGKNERTEIVILPCDASPLHVHIIQFRSKTHSWKLYEMMILISVDK